MRHVDHRRISQHSGQRKQVTDEIGTEGRARHHIRKLFHPPLSRIVLSNRIWHKSAMLTFLEKFVLTILAALFVLVITNPMHLGLGLRVGVALGIVIAAYFCGRAIHKQAGASRAKVAAKDAGQLREKHGVARLQETQSEKTFAEIPPNSFCFMYGHSLVGDYKVGHVNADKDTLKFEVHKLTDGAALVVGYVGPETRDRLLGGLKKGETLTIYSRSCGVARDVIAVPVDHLKFNRSRTLEISYKQLSALDCEAR